MHWLNIVGIQLEIDYCHYQPGRFVKVKIQIFSTQAVACFPQKEETTTLARDPGNWFDPEQL